MSGEDVDRRSLQWLEREHGLFSAATARLRASEQLFEESLARTTANIAAQAQKVEAKQAVVELRPRPAVDLDEFTRKLRQDGPQSLTGRERRAVVSHPAQVAARDAERVLKQWPALLRHTVRSVLLNWYQFKGQAWGSEYFDLMCTSSKGSGIPLLEKTLIGPQRALSRHGPSGDVHLAASLGPGSVVAVYDRLREELGLRDSWLYTGQVLASWLELQVTRGTPLDDTLDAIRRHPRLRALLLPPPNNGSAIAGVCLDALTHARTVATLLRAAFVSPALLSKMRLAELTDDTMRSSFRDPRLPPLSQGWELVKQLAEEPFRRWLASLSEQDLEVFFAHAMNEPDRRKFWMAYLPQIERTGCVLDASSQESLRAKLQASPELKGAITRAYRFRRSSGVQAFFLVFARIVVVEFSDTGNAAYVYEREYFEQNVEKNVRAMLCGAAPDLKIKSARMHKFNHHSGWQADAARWLCEQGIHVRPGLR